MSGPFPKYQSGGFGPKDKQLTHAHINRITAATERVEGLTGRSDRGVATVIRSMVVELIDTVGAIGGRPFWSWKQVGVASGSGSIAYQPTQIQSSMYIASQGGYAVSLDGSGEAGAIVTIHELPAFDGKRWFAFGGSGGTATGTALLINSGDGPFPITYSVTEGKIDGTGAFVSSGLTGFMYNLYEFDPYGHGQDLVFSQGELQPEPLQGIVFGSMTMIDGTIRVYICDVPNPMNPVCAGSSPGGFGGAAQASQQSRSAIIDTLRYGL